jgi:phosphotriesterase-related protein
MTMVNTVLGPCTPEDLGVTLMHEHLLIGWPGWEADAAAPPFQRREVIKMSIDRMHELKALGLRTFLDPCPIDLGRDVELMAEVAQATGVHLICATGLYKEDQGATPYFKFRSQVGDAVKEMTEAFIKELTEGIGSTGIKPGILKVATQAHRISPYEEMVLRAAARASNATGTPITTHTDEGTMGREQLDIFASEGVDLQRVIIGHSCGSADLRYHVDMLDRGCFLGFDRFGLEILQPDRLRKAALIGLLGIDFHKQIVLSHDTVWCWRGRPLPMLEMAVPYWKPTHVFKNIIPSLRESGVAQEKIDAMLVDNPRRVFAGNPTC